MAGTSLILVIFVLIISLWTLISNGLLLTCFILNRDKKWPDFSTNISALTVNAFLKGLSGILSASVSLIAMFSFIDDLLISITVVIFFVIIAHQTLQTFFIFIQRCCVISLNRPALTKKTIQLVHCGLLFIAAIIIGTLLLNSEANWYICDNTNNPKGIALCASFVIGLPNLLSYIIYIFLLFMAKRRMRKVLPLSIPEAKVVNTFACSTLYSVKMAGFIIPEMPATVTHFSTAERATTLSETTYKNVSKPRISIVSTRYVGGVPRDMPNKRTKKISSLSITGKVNKHESNLKKRSLVRQVKALKTMGYYMLANTSVPLILMLLSSLLRTFPAESKIIEKMFWVGFALLNLNTSFNIFIFVSRYKIIKDAYLQMLGKWKRAALDNFSCRLR